MERIPVSRHGPNEPRGSRVIIERCANFSHRIVQACVGDEGALPEDLDELLLRDCLGPAIEKQLQEPERLRRERRRAPMAEEQPLSGVQLEVSEGYAYGLFFIAVHLRLEIVRGSSQG